MIRQLLTTRTAKLVAGFACGVSISTLLLLLSLQALGYFDSSKARLLERRLHAAAAQAGGAMAVATGLIDEGVEGIFVLDFISGDLTCGVLNPRNGQLGGLFKRNVVQDLGVEQGKQPKYLMVTGEFQITGQVNNTKPAFSLVYVGDANTGKYVGYMLPWNSQLLNANRTQVQPMIPIGFGSARNLQLE